MVMTAARLIDVRELHGPTATDRSLMPSTRSPPASPSSWSRPTSRASCFVVYRPTRRDSSSGPPSNRPASFRTEISRRAAEPGARREVAEALAWDHDRLDALEHTAFELFADGDAEGARARWSEFTVGLKRHIRFEEEILFPTFEEKTGLSPANGPTEVMREEHREIERLIEAIGRVFSGEGAALPLRDDLQHVLGQHNLKEERVLYPGTDQCLDPEERDALVARIQAT